MQGCLSKKEMSNKETIIIPCSKCFKPYSQQKLRINSGRIDKALCDDCLPCKTCRENHELGLINCYCLCHNENRYWEHKPIK
jgi:hypothetical protein